MALTDVPSKDNSRLKQAGSAPGWFALNLALLVGLGVSVLYWIGYHTELLGVVGGVLGLGGAFAWAAFVLGLVRPVRKEELQLLFDRLLSRRWMAPACLAGAVIVAAVGGLFGSVRIDARREVTDRFVEIRSVRGSNARLVHADVLPARSVRTFPVFVGWGRRAYEVRVDGLPALTVEASRYHRRTVVAPDGFLHRNIVLLRPTTEVSQTARKIGYELTIQIGKDDPVALTDYRGETVWIGCDDAVAIPVPLRERWRLELVAQGLPEAMMLPWLSPRALAKERTLARGEWIKIAVGHPGENPWTRAEAVVEECGRPDCFPQEVIISAP